MGDAVSDGKYISAIYRHMQIMIAAELAPFHIGSGQYNFLITQIELSQDLLIDKTTTAKAIAKLETEGYVRREADPEDNRRHLLFLTDAGRSMIPMVPEALNHVKNKSRKGIKRAMTNVDNPSK